MNKYSGIEITYLLSLQCINEIVVSILASLYYSTCIISCEPNIRVTSITVNLGGGMGKNTPYFSKWPLHLESMGPFYNVTQ